MASAIDAGISFTPPYGKSASRGQMRHAHTALRARCAFHASAVTPVSARQQDAERQGPIRHGAVYLIIR
jgi:hypothetical protein